jgi:magnesium transporter
MAMTAAPVQEVLNDPITQHMRTDYAAIRIDQTVGEALSEIRSRPLEGRIIYFYVVDPENHLVGVVPTRRLLLSPLDTPIAEITIRKVISLPSSATVLDACAVFMMHRLLALPIVDDEKRLIGVVDVDLYTEELSEIDRSERNEDLFQLIGVHLIDARKQNAWVSFRDRFPWLMCNIAGGILAAFLSGLFEAELQQAVALALFIPVVLALAESVAIQSVSLTLQAIHGRQPTVTELLQKLRAELLVGLFLGSACAMVVGTVAMLWLGQRYLLACLFGGIAGGVTAAAIIGVAMPNLLRLFQREPQVAAGPIVLALTDMVTLIIYFGLARLLAPLFWNLPTL